ncbi:MAG: hypothetical protein J6S09_06985 [Paludibacteraceae bacterium]|nr:hypothetical protein [Paludibacteraceae bacterium]
MKKIVTVILLSVLAFSLTGCEGFNQPSNGNSTQQRDEYYVKYTISSSFYYFGSITYADVNGTKHDRTGDYNRTSLKWEVIVGPVKKGFNSHVSYSRGSANIVKIEVSKNNGPFVLKASGDDSANYIIDF